jgi:hypothetical protein
MKSATTFLLPGALPAVFFRPPVCPFKPPELLSGVALGAPPVAVNVEGVDEKPE